MVRERVGRRLGEAPKPRVRSSRGRSRGLDGLISLDQVWDTGIQKLEIEFVNSRKLKLDLELQLELNDRSAQSVSDQCPQRN